MKFGICSFAYRWAIGRPYYRPEKPMQIKTFLDKVASFGVNYALLCNNFDWRDLTRGQLEDIRNYSADRGISLDLGARETDPEIYRKLIDDVQFMGSSVLRMVYDLERSKDPAKDRAELDKLYRCLEKILPFAKEAGVTLALENGPILIHTEIAQIIEDFGRENLGACPDSMNCIYSVHRPDEVFKTLAPYAVMAHLKDYTIVPNKRGYVIQGTALGKGDADFARLTQYLKDAGFQGTAYLEMYIDRRETLEETLAYEEDCVQQSMDHVRELCLI